MFENFYEGNLKKKRIDLFDFNNSVNGRIDGYLSKYTRAKNCYNFDYTDGALKCGIGVKPLEILLGEIITSQKRRKILFRKNFIIIKGTTTKPIRETTE